MKCRFIREIGTSAWLRVYWDDFVGVPQSEGTGSHACPNAGGQGRAGVHDARLPLTTSDKLADWTLGGIPSDYPDDRWPTACERCGAAVPITAPPIYGAGPGADGPRLERQVFRSQRYDTASGEPGPGDMFLVGWLHHDGHCIHWDDCTTPHLMVVLSTGHRWDVDGRAANCALPQDRHHRCWVRHGDPPDVTVDKGGKTCAAGGGSIAVPGYHGMLQGGVLVP